MKKGSLSTAFVSTAMFSRDTSTVSADWRGRIFSVNAIFVLLKKGLSTMSKFL